MFAALAMAFALSSCTTVVQAPRRASPRSAAPRVEHPTEPYTLPELPPPEAPAPDVPAPSRALPEKPSPRATASLQLTEQGRTLLAKGRYDEAISMLERAVSMNPAGGRNFYYLSQAWLAKGNISQAREFHKRAEMYLQGESEWEARLDAQRQQIERMKAKD